MPTKAKRKMNESIIYDETLLVSEIQKLPQTYESLLNGSHRPTLELIARKKLNRLCREGIICKMSIPCTRFGKALFFTPDKKYKILIESGRGVINIYCFEKYVKQGVYRIKVENYYLLKDKVWVEHNMEKEFFEGNVLRFL